MQHSLWAWCAVLLFSPTPRLARSNVATTKQANIKAECSLWSQQIGWQESKGCCQSVGRAPLAPIHDYNLLEGKPIYNSQATPTSLFQILGAFVSKCKRWCASDVHCVAAWVDQSPANPANHQQSGHLTCHLFSYTGTGTFTSGAKHSTCSDPHDKCMIKKSGCVGLPAHDACGADGRQFCQTQGSTKGAMCQVPAFPLSKGKCAGMCFDWTFDLETRTYGCDATAVCPYDKQPKSLAVCEGRADCTGFDGWSAERGCCKGSNAIPYKRALVQPQSGSPQGNKEDCRNLCAADILCTAASFESNPDGAAAEWCHLFDVDTTGWGVETTADNGCYDRWAITLCYQSVPLHLDALRRVLSCSHTFISHRGGSWGRVCS